MQHIKDVFTKELSHWPMEKGWSWALAIRAILDIMDDKDCSDINEQYGCGTRWSTMPHLDKLDRWEAVLKMWSENELKHFLTQMFPTWDRRMKKISITEYRAATLQAIELLCMYDARMNVWSTKKFN